MKKTINSALLLIIAYVASAQPFTYEQYNKLVAENNALYLAEKYSIDIATASMKSAKVFNDPELSISYGNNQDWDIMMGQSLEVSLSITPDLAGVRKARIEVAKSEKELTEASVSAFLSNLRLESAIAWAEAWKLQRSCSILEESVNDMMQIALSDSLRFSIGDIGRADALQSNLEAQTLYGELLKMRSDYCNALNALSLFCGGYHIDSLSNELPQYEMDLFEDDIYAMAEANRADLKAALISKTLSNNNLKLLHASRAFEMGIDIGYSYNTEVRNEIAPAPVFKGISAGITIPLKFSSFNKGEVNAARGVIIQSEKYYEAARLQVRSEAIQAYNSFIAAEYILNQYTDLILSDAKSIVQGRKEGYLKGESTLLEYLSAQQTYLDIMQTYIEACCEHFICRAQLEYAIGL